jgi:hypothetical protein
LSNNPERKLLLIHIYTHMQKFKALLYFFMIGMVSLTACKDDDAEEGPLVADNTVSINNQTFNLNQAFLLEGNDPGTSVDNHILAIASTAGDDFVVFSIFRPEGQTTLAGTYTAAPSSSMNANTFNGAFMGINCEEDDSGQAMCDNEYRTGDTPTGTLTITKSGNIFTVNFDVNFTDGSTETLRGLGNYIGSISGAE